VPQTVFLKAHTSDFPSQSSLSLRPLIHDGSHRTSLLSPRAPQSVDHSSSGTPFEDLRRRLATINGSVSSVGHSQSSPRNNLSPHLGGPSASSSSHHASAIPDRPSSPTESILSTTNSQTFQPTSRLQIGSTDGQKAAPAIGSSKTNATGLLDAHSHLRAEESPDLSGRSSPVSMSTTLRQPPPSLLPISTYGMSFPLFQDPRIEYLYITLDGQEPGISNLLENLYLDNHRELQQDFGPKVHDGPIRRRNGSRHVFTSRDGRVRQTEAALIAHLSSHSDAITGIAVSPDHMFFVTTSDDKTAKVWDTARLERNVTSKPRHTYNQHHAKVKCVCILESSHCFASAADDGSLHVVRVHTTQSGALPKYTKLQVIREHRVDKVGEYVTCMVHYNTGNMMLLELREAPC